jgi:hypothetical protein
MHVVLGALLGAAAVAALQAVAVAYLVGLMVAAVVVAGAPVLLASIVVARDPKSHWLRRPIGLGAILGIATVGAAALSLRLLGSGVLGSGDDVSFVRPYLPGILALPVDLILLVVLAVRGARSGRKAIAGADLRGGAQSLGLLAGRALCRGVAIVVYGAGTLVMCAAIVLAIASDEPGDPRGGFLILGAVCAFVVGGLGSLFAWWGRVPRAIAGPPR